MLASLGRSSKRRQRERRDDEQGGHLCVSAGADITNDHRLSGSNDGNVLFHSSGT